MTIETHEFIQGWQNLHGTHQRANVQFFRLDRKPGTPSGAGTLAAFGSAIRGVVNEAFAARQTLRPDGSRWALSNLAQPEHRAVQLASVEGVFAIPEEFLSADYRARCKALNITPIYVIGNVRIGRLNRLLGQSRLALQTSGASDGQTLAGATASSTHGGSIPIGALHDTVAAVHLLVSPTEALLVQPKAAPFNDEFAIKFGELLGCDTTSKNDDECFHAAQVHLGSLGIVLGMVVEAVPQYALRRTRTVVHDDETWRRVLRDIDPTHANTSTHQHQAHPAHFEVVLNPFEPNPTTAPQGWVISMAKVPDNPTDPKIERTPQGAIPPHPDLVAVIAQMQDELLNPLLDPMFRKIVTGQLVSRYGSTNEPDRWALPGVMFGPTALPEGRGDSIEFAVSGEHAERASVVLRQAIRDSMAAGIYFGGAMGIRMVGPSPSLLAMNTLRRTCFIELPGIRNQAIQQVFDRCAAALDKAKIPWTCHWGQSHRLNRTRVRGWWGDRADRWVIARKSLLSPIAQEVFASPLLRDVGLV